MSFTGHSLLRTWSMAGRGKLGRAQVSQGMCRAGLCELARYDVPTSHELEGRERCDGFVWRVLPR